MPKTGKKGYLFINNEYSNISISMCILRCNANLHYEKKITN